MRAKMRARDLAVGLIMRRAKRKNICEVTSAININHESSRFATDTRSRSYVRNRVRRVSAVFALWVNDYVSRMNKSRVPGI